MSCAASESVNCFVTNSRTCSFERVSTLGGVLYLSPTAFSIIGTASATSAAYGPWYCGFSLWHADTSMTSAPPAKERLRLSSTLICTQIRGKREVIVIASEAGDPQVPRDDRVSVNQRDQRSGRKKDAERKFTLAPRSPHFEGEFRLSLVVGESTRGERVYDTKQY